MPGIILGNQFSYLKFGHWILEFLPAGPGPDRGRGRQEFAAWNLEIGI